MFCDCADHIHHLWRRCHPCRPALWMVMVASAVSLVSLSTLSVHSLIVTMAPCLLLATQPTRTSDPQPWKSSLTITFRKPPWIAFHAVFPRLGVCVAITMVWTLLWGPLSQGRLTPVYYRQAFWWRNHLKGRSFSTCSKSRPSQKLLDEVIKCSLLVYK